MPLCGLADFLFLGRAPGVAGAGAQMEISDCWAADLYAHRAERMSRFNRV